ncbi:hypothetical protein NDU88_011054 [Pleurodeles waltl]|uniref:Uncharacterized protein n=1 Tax=Pleurodeles waltl TaxID=8319 RepID=A0AAV7S2J9_PLEWA|nr:hypothetical protein NDU88_011054 [Pleurodeles waltl]
MEWFGRAYGGGDGTEKSFGVSKRRTNRFHIKINSTLLGEGPQSSSRRVRLPQHLKECAYISGIAAGATQTFNCHGMVGRYVNIIVRGRKEYLMLCEVQVFA